MNVKTELAKKAGNIGQVKLNKNMAITNMIKALEPEIARALPSVITPERFTRMALNALNNTPKLAECTQMSFLGALMSAAQLGLEPNDRIVVSDTTPLITLMKIGHLLTESTQRPRKGAGSW